MARLDDVHETEHPVVDRMDAVDADDQVATVLRKPMAYLRPPGCGRRPDQQYARKPAGREKLSGMESTCRWVGNSAMSMTTLPSPSVIEYGCAAVAFATLQVDGSGETGPEAPWQRSSAI